MHTIPAKLFKNGQSQAVRIPRIFQFEGIDEVLIRREGDAVIITPKRKSWTSLANLPLADEDFLQHRPDLFDSNRVVF
ncbi:MAG: type II toxin-antitoxin system VapB family antitoxin [Thiolinea sp.]